jgi:hypothetical protein
VSECAVSDSAGVIEAVVEAAPTLGSMEDVVEVVVTLSAAVCAGLVCAVAIREVAEICGGGNLVKKRRSRGCSDCASWTCLSMAVGVQYNVVVGWCCSESRLSECPGLALKRSSGMDSYGASAAGALASP